MTSAPSGERQKEIRESLAAGVDALPARGTVGRACTLRALLVGACAKVTTHGVGETEVELNVDAHAATVGACSCAGALTTASAVVANRTRGAVRVARTERPRTSVDPAHTAKALKARATGSVGTARGETRAAHTQLPRGATAVAGARSGVGAMAVGAHLAGSADGRDVG